MTPTLIHFQPSDFPLERLNRRRLRIAPCPEVLEVFNRKEHISACVALRFPELVQWSAASQSALAVLVPPSRLCPFGFLASWRAINCVPSFRALKISWHPAHRQTAAPLSPLLFLPSSQGFGALRSGHWCLGCTQGTAMASQGDLPGPRCRPLFARFLLLGSWLLPMGSVLATRHSRTPAVMKTRAGAPSRVETPSLLFGASSCCQASISILERNRKGTLVGHR